MNDCHTLRYLTSVVWLGQGGAGFHCGYIALVDRTDVQGGIHTSGSIFEAVHQHCIQRALHGVWRCNNNLQQNQLLFVKKTQLIRRLGHPENLVISSCTKASDRIIGNNEQII